MHSLDAYRPIVGSELIDSILQIAAPLRKKIILFVNSTKTGGGVAEIFSRMIPLMQGLGIYAQWETIQAEKDFFQCTKLFHNLLQGEAHSLDANCLRTYEAGNAKNAALLRSKLEQADLVFIHDPQPLALISYFPERTCPWIWRCHIDLSSPSEQIWTYLKKYINLYDASIFSLKEFAQTLSCPIYFIPPSIDPLNEKNLDLPPKEIQRTYAQFGIDLDRPTLLQVSRFDRFKDPIGVIEAYRIAKREVPKLQLILAGSAAIDDPEGDEVLQEARNYAAKDSDIYLLLLSPTSHLQINALQRGATIVLQKSLREGFGLTVSEALWKSKPVIGGDTGGIRIQLIDGKTGFLVNSPEEAGDRIKYLLTHPQKAEEFGKNGRERVREHFLIPRHLHDLLTVFAAHLFPHDQTLAAKAALLNKGNT